MLFRENRARKGAIMSTGHFHRTAVTHPELDRLSGGVLSGTATKVLAVLRIATGFIFLWAFLDKLFGLNYSTKSGKSWISGGSPTKGFLSSVDVGPLSSAFHSIAGTWWADSLFMLGLMAIGVALIAGVFLRLAAVAGVIQLGLMWFAEFPLAQTTSGGQPSGSRPTRWSTTTSCTPWCWSCLPSPTPVRPGDWVAAGRRSRSCSATTGCSESRRA